MVGAGRRGGAQEEQDDGEDQKASLQPVSFE